ncbi:MAG: serine/threonine-protein kinase [Cyanobacteria bacterium P01_A01_bin.116]
MSKYEPKKSTRTNRDNQEATATLTTKDRFTTWQQQTVYRHWRFAISAVCTAVAAGAVGLNLGIVNLWERQVQSLFFELRGPVATPDNIVILTIDEDSLSQGQYYSADPERYASLKPIESWPWQRQAYARVIEKLMDAGADAIAIDVVFASSSSYGEADDKALINVLERYGKHVVLAAEYPTRDRSQGEWFQPILPRIEFRDAGARVGVINFRLEPNRQIHRLGQEFLRELADTEADLLGTSATILDEDAPLKSLAQEAIAAAGKPDSAQAESYENVFFYGPSGTFKHIPFWHVLDDDPWRNQLQSGRAFKDKIVLIGTTAAFHQDFHKAPFSQSLLYPQSMAGVEVLANTIATLDQAVSPTRAIKDSRLNALLVLALGLGIAGLMNRSDKPLNRSIIAVGGLGLWGIISYAAFVGSRTILITGTPIAAIATLGLLDFGVGFTADRLKRKRLKTTLARYATSPLIQEIISQQDDFQELLNINRTDIIGTLLRDRYRILKVLGAGGFGETYLAQDTLRPGNPVCVVKQLKIVSDNPKAHHLAQRLFEAEAAVLEKLGEHPQIPRLLAYFDVQQSFYLVQEMVEGKLLRNVLSRSRPMSQRAVVGMLRDLLPVISFVHSKGVIHRDIKPSNIIRRAADKRYVLIDFGAVKTISNKLADTNTQITSTVGIGTQGYMPSEQSAGMPTVRSDIYALGITAIEALTGRPPHALKRSDNGEIIWSHTIKDISPELSKIINTMVRYDFNKRYSSPQKVLDDLVELNSEILADNPATGPDFQAVEEATYNQGTRPGVIATNEELGSTQILPDNWPNELETREEPSSTIDDDPSPNSKPNL